MARLSGGDEVEGLDEEFLFHLNKGSDLLARGEADPARASLEKALELRPKDTKVLGLLGQAFYKLQQYEDATIAWQRLVDENPVEPAARVNLGLAYLKAKQYPEATRQLEIALDLNPEHKKAMGYLGLALLESGNALRAREWFHRAGSEQMVARCDEVLSGNRPAGATAAVTPAPIPPAEAAEPPPAPEPIRTPIPASLPAVTPAPMAAVRGAGPSGEAWRSASPGTEAPAAAPAAGGGAEPLATYAEARLVPASHETFSTSGGVLSIAVRGEVRVRLDGLLAARGRVALAPERKRFRGRATDQAFGDGASRVHRASGDGTLLFRADRRFTALSLAGEPAYLRDEVLFGFEDGLAFENGRLPSSTSAELHLVLLRGRGAFLVRTAGEPVALEVSADAPLRVPLAALVGWTGALTPRVTTLVEEDGDPPVAAVELSGEGRALVDPAAVGGAGAGG